MIYKIYPEYPVTLTHSSTEKSLLKPLLRPLSSPVAPRPSPHPYTILKARTE